MGETRANTSNRGFASMDAEKQRAIASKGGKAAHQKGTAHQFSSEEARIAGSKGGRAARQKRSQQAAAAQAGTTSTNTANKDVNRDRLVLKQGERDQQPNTPMNNAEDNGTRMIDPRDQRPAFGAGSDHNEEVGSAEPHGRVSNG